MRAMDLKERENLGIYLLGLKFAIRDLWFVWVRVMDTGLLGLQVARVTVGSQDFPLWRELGLQLDSRFFRYLW